ncbi:hypothetical protein CP8484711_1295C, partial [Chlamydia psittaci 84-8471/1]
RQIRNYSKNYESSKTKSGAIPRSQSRIPL